MIAGKMDHPSVVDRMAERGPALEAAGRSPASDASASRSRRLGPPARAEQLEQVVRAADQQPFRLDFPETAKREAPEGLARLDLAEDRFRDRFPERVDRVARGGLQLGPHLSVITLIDVGIIAL